MAMPVGFGFVPRRVCPLHEAQGLPRDPGLRHDRRPAAVAMMTAGIAAGGPGSYVRRYGLSANASEFRRQFVFVSRHRSSDFAGRPVSGQNRNQKPVFMGVFKARFRAFAYPSPWWLSCPRGPMPLSENPARFHLETGEFHLGNRIIGKILLRCRLLENRPKMWGRIPSLVSCTGKTSHVSSVGSLSLFQPWSNYNEQRNEEV
jgi:hypothetical protein